MTSQFSSRTQLLIGTEGVARLQSAHALVVGLGGVGAMLQDNRIAAQVIRLPLSAPVN